MKTQHARSTNAVKHGIFVHSPVTPGRTDLGDLAQRVLPAHIAQNLSDDIATAERQVSRCRDAIAGQLLVIERILDIVGLDGDPRMSSLDAEIDNLTRLLGYQAAGMNKLRKGRLAVLNAAEGIGRPTRSKTG